jgi:tetratricopeptide (TPR) repeat protein
VFAATVLAGATRGLRAQSTGAVVDTIAEARRLRDAREYGGAAAILGPYVAGHPDDPGAARLAALMFYWSKDLAVARATYERALERHPNDADLRADFGRFLVDLGQTVRAREVLTPLAQTGRPDLPASGRALTLLGTLDYWRGDYARARNHFIESLTVDPTDADARRQLREIELASASWVSVGGSSWQDDQPLDHMAFEAEGGWFASPVTPLSVRVGSTQFTHEGVSETLSRADAGFATFLPGPRLDVSVRGGVVDRTFGDGSDWTARAALGMRLPGHVALEGRFERAPYLNTTASVATSVMTQTFDATLRWRAPTGWTGDATARRETFDDDNAITTGYVWLLAPVARGSGGQMQVGYSFAAQSATYSRFVPRDDAVTLPPRQASATVPGIYDPYYTPRNLRVHSGLLSATVRPTPRWSIAGNGSVGVHARDDAPVLVAVSRPPNVDVVRDYAVRNFRPWNVRGTLEGSVTDAVRLALTAEHGKGPYYVYTTAGVRLTYTFVAAARRRADRY